MKRNPRAMSIFAATLVLFGVFGQGGAVLASAASPVTASRAASPLCAPAGLESYDLRARQVQPLTYDFGSWDTAYECKTNLCGAITEIAGLCLFQSSDGANFGYMRCVLQRDENNSWVTYFDSGLKFFFDETQFPIASPFISVAPGEVWRLGVAGTVTWADENEETTPNYPNIDINYWNEVTIP